MALENGVKEKNGVTYVETSLQPSKRQRVRRICARWWWLFFLIFAAGVLAGVLPIIYVAYPKMARNAIANSKINVTSMTISNPRPNSIDLSFEQVFISDSKYKPKLYPFNASLYLIDKPDNPAFASFQTPEIKGGNGVRSTVPQQVVNITHMSEFTRYVLVALGFEKFTIALRGHGELQQDSLPKAGVDYNTNITLSGFNALKGFELLDFHLLNASEPDGTNGHATATIPNPTVMTIDLGTVSFDLYSVNNTAVGNATIDSLVLKPGNNTVTMRVTAYELVVVGIVFTTQSAIVPVEIRGNRSTYNGEILPYYTTMLQAANLKANINVTEAVQGTNLTQKRDLMSFR